MYKKIIIVVSCCILLITSSLFSFSASSSNSFYQYFVWDEKYFTDGEIVHRCIEYDRHVSDDSLIYFESIPYELQQSRQVFHAKFHLTNLNPNAFVHFRFDINVLVCDSDGHPYYPLISSAYLFGSDGSQYTAFVNNALHKVVFETPNEFIKSDNFELYIRFDSVVQYSQMQMQLSGLNLDFSSNNYYSPPDTSTIEEEEEIERSITDAYEEDAYNFLYGIFVSAQGYFDNIKISFQSLSRFFNNVLLTRPIGSIFVYAFVIGIIPLLLGKVLR